MLKFIPCLKPSPPSTVEQSGGGLWTPPVMLGPRCEVHYKYPRQSAIQRYITHGFLGWWFMCSECTSIPSFCCPEAIEYESHLEHLMPQRIVPSRDTHMPLAHLRPEENNAGASVPISEPGNPLHRLSERHPRVVHCRGGEQVQ